MLTKNTKTENKEKINEETEKQNKEKRNQLY